MIGQLGHVLVGFVDNVMVGQLGATPLAAVSLGNSLIFIALSLGIGFSYAITPLMAQSDGSGNVVEGQRYFRHGVMLCLLNGLILWGILYASYPLLSRLSQPEEVVVLAIPYLKIVAFSMLPLMLFQGFKQAADGLSVTKVAMAATLLANLLNVLFNYTLIYGKFGFPRMEIEGAAWGTALSRIFMVIFMIYFLKNHKKCKIYMQHFTSIQVNKAYFTKIIKIGLPSAMQMFFEVGIFSATILLAGTLGTLSQAANQIALNLASMTFMIAVGLGVTATIRVGNQKGKQDFEALRRIGHSVFLLVILIEAVFAVLFLILRNYLPLLYLDLDNSLQLADNSLVIAEAAILLVIAGFFQLSDGIQVVVLGALRGLQDVRVPTYITFVAYWLIGFPTSYFLGKADVLGSLGIWLGLLTGLSAAAAMLYIRFHLITKKMIVSG
ncbi:MAG: MATE family efflux transporter [Bacteroidetes bacterium]|nr:MATE family efflux transporter [Bacteroidota bacterium]